MVKKISHLDEQQIIEAVIDAAREVDCSVVTLSMRLTGAPRINMAVIFFSVSSSFFESVPTEHGCPTAIMEMASASSPLPAPGTGAFRQVHRRPARRLGALPKARRACL